MEIPIVESERIARTTEINVGSVLKQFIILVTL